MKLTISSSLDGSVFPVEVADDMEVMNFKALLECESGLPADQIQLTYQATVLEDGSRSLSDYGIADNGLVQMGIVEQPRQPVAPPAPQPAQGPISLPQFDWSSISVAGAPSAGSSGPPPAQRPALPESPLAIREQLLSDPVQAQRLSENNPSLYGALVSGDPEKFVAELERQQRAREEENVRRIRMLAADPFDLEAQRDIAENIRMENVNANMETAMEHNPEAFGQVIMLYVHCKVNGVPVKAFVDSGAQMTIMSAACAERCNIMRLVDRRWSGIAKGEESARWTSRRLKYLHYFKKKKKKKKKERKKRFY